MNHDLDDIIDRLERIEIILESLSRSPKIIIDKMYSVQQIATHLGIGKHKVLTLIRNGDLDAINVATKPGARPQLRISHDALDKFKKRRSTEPEPKIERRRRRPRPFGDVEKFV